MVKFIRENSIHSVRMIGMQDILMTREELSIMSETFGMDTILDCNRKDAFDFLHKVGVNKV